MIRPTHAYAVALLVALAASPAAAQTLPSGVINAPPTVIGDNESIGSDTILNVMEGGSVGANFEAMSGSIVNVSGGAIGDDFTAINSTVNFSSGTIGGFFRALQDSTVNITGGDPGALVVGSDSVANINSGIDGVFLTAAGGGVININAGKTDGVISIFDGGVMNVNGGEIEGGPVVNPGGQINLNDGTMESVTLISGFFVMNGGTITGSVGANRGSVILRGGTVEGGLGIGRALTIEGTEFYLDGVMIDLEPGVRTVIPDRDVVLSGLLADGTPFDVDLFETREGGRDSISPVATLTLTLVVPEPSTAALLSLFAAMGAPRRSPRAA